MSTSRLSEVRWSMLAGSRVQPSSLVLVCRQPHLSSREPHPHHPVLKPGPRAPCSWPRVRGAGGDIPTALRSVTSLKVQVYVQGHTFGSSGCV